jgi:hypothetical protein
MATEDHLIVWSKEHGNTTALITQIRYWENRSRLSIGCLCLGGRWGQLNSAVCSFPWSVREILIGILVRSLLFFFLIPINSISSLSQINLVIMPPQGAAYNVDWIFSNTSNVHVANDRAWFTTYTPFRTKVATMSGAEPSAEVHGIGTVVLPTRTHRQGKSHKPSGELTLHHVLHAPGNIVNIFAACKEPDISININFGGDVVSPITKPGSTKVIGLLVRSRLFKLWLKGQSQNQSSLDPEELHYIHASWPQSETKKFNDHLAALKKQQASEADDAPPLTQEEKQYLKEHYGGEYKFLRLYQLSIYKEEDREEGRRILRAFMSESEDEDDDQDSVEAEMEEDPTSHLADYKFDSHQLDFLKTHHGHSGNFMRCYGLKPWDNDDCDEALRIVEAFMEDEE